MLLSSKKQASSYACRIDGDMRLLFKGFLMFSRKRVGLPPSLDRAGWDTHAPVNSRGEGELLGRKEGEGEVVAARDRNFAIAFAFSRD